MMASAQKLITLTLVMVLGTAWPNPSRTRSSETSTWRCLKSHAFGLTKEARLMSRVEESLERKLATEEREEILSINLEIDGRAPTLEDAERYERRLLRAGISAPEITRLWRDAVFGGARIDWQQEIPTEIKVFQAKLFELDGQVAANLKEGARLRYVVDQANQMHLMLDNPPLDNKAIWFVRGYEGSGNDTALFIKEAGDIWFDSKTNEFRLKPKYSIELHPEETSEILANAQMNLKDFEIKRDSDNTNNKYRILNCLAILAANQAGNSFVFDRMLAENLVFGATIAVQELAGADRLKTEKGRKLVYADFLGNSLGTLISAKASKHLVVNDKGLAVQMGTRAALGFSIIEVQRNVYQAVLMKKDDKAESQDAQEKIDRIIKFNQAHFVARLPINYWFDKKIMNDLPKKLVSACKRGSKLHVIISPRAVRIYERFGSAMIYYGVRRALVE